MVNKEIISHLPLLYLYISFLNRILIYPFLTLKLLYIFNLPNPTLFFSLSLRNSLYIYFAFPPNLFPLYSPILLSSSSFISFGVSSISSVRPYREELVVLLEHPSGEIR